MPKNTAKIGVFWIMQKNIPLNDLQDSDVWKKSSSQVKCKNALGQSDRKIFNL